MVMEKFVTVYQNIHVKTKQSKPRLKSSLKAVRIMYNIIKFKRNIYQLAYIPKKQQSKPIPERLKDLRKTIC